MAARKTPATPSTPPPSPKSATKSTARGRSPKETVSPATPAKVSKTPASKAPGRSRAATTAAAAAPAPMPAKAVPPPTVTLKQLAAQLTEAHAMPRKQGEVVLADLVGLVVEHLKAGERLQLQGLGVLEVRHRPARQGRNPATGATMEIAASKKIAFRPSKALKEAV